MEKSQMQEKAELAKIFQHIVQPEAHDVFYHYCSLETFRVICDKKTLRFSDINMMNDYGENAWGYRIFEKAATHLLRPDRPPELKDITKSFFDDVDNIIGPIQFFLHPVIFSLSRNPDVLSQWRSYADGGRGVAIGFSGPALAALPSTIIRVEYDEATQVAEMAEALAIIYAAESKRNHTRGAEFRTMCRDVAVFKAAFKNPLFSEEQEVRCVHLLTVQKNGSMIKLVDDVNIVDGKEVPGQPVQFRISDGGIIAFIDMLLPMTASGQPIKEIWKGPKNDNAPGNIMYMMGAAGFKDYKICRSLATFR